MIALKGLSMIDLHLHSSCSDGALTPAELIAKARQAGLTNVALCDHDTIAGVKTAMSAGMQVGVNVIPGVELSVCFKSFSDVHLLGYFIDFDNAELRERLDTFALRRSNRNLEIIAAVNRLLQQEGRDSLTTEEVTIHADGVMGRPHIARALLLRGYADSMEDAFSRYLVPCDVPKAYWPMEDALQTIHRIGGVAVLAHPTSITRDLGLLSNLIEELQKLGLDGLEVYNNLATEAEMQFLQNVARRLNLLITGGSDYHGIEDQIQIGKGRGGIRFADALLPPLRAVAARRRSGQLSTCPCTPDS